LNGYGQVDPSKFLTIPRYYNMSLFETLPKSYFTDRNISIENGTSFDTKYGTVIVQDIKGDNVTIFYYWAQGQKMEVNGVPIMVASLNMTDFTAVMEYNLALNKTYQLPNPDTGVQTSYLVANKTDTNITLDHNHPLAGKTLDFEVTLLKIQKGS
jgi:FKBP-type peptidyl-prolyl cis-trans isomerase 2